MMGDVLWYVLNSGAWSAFGFVSGWYFARTALDVRAIRKKVVDDDKNK